MRILFLSNWFPYPPDNGSKIRAYHLLKGLGDEHEVTLLSFAHGTADPDAAREMMPFCSNVLSVARNPFQRSHAAQALRFLSPVPIVTLPLPEMTQATRTVLASQPFGVVIASTQVMATYALQAAQPVTRVLEEHNSLTRWMEERYREQGSPVQRLRCWLSWKKTTNHEARLFRRFQLCTMVSDQDRQATLRNMSGDPGHIEVVPNGVDCQHNRPSSAAAEPNTLVFNGSMTYYANYDAMRYFLAKVFPLVQQQEPGVSLTITGPTSGVDMSGLRLNEGVRFSGYLDDIRPLLTSASACVVPIRTGGGTRLKILEAMALGTPVVSTSKGAEGLRTTPGKDILIADEPAEFASHVICLLRDPALRERLGTRARRLVEQQYNWREISHRFVDLVEDTANRHVVGKPAK